MYGLPDDFDPNIFVERQLESVTYGVNVIVLAFANRLTVSISGSLPYSVDEHAEVRVDRPPVLSTVFVSLVGRIVRSFDLKSPRELILKFEGGGSVTLLDDEEMYECYLINTGEREIVV